MSIRRQGTYPSKSACLPASNGLLEITNGLVGADHDLKLEVVWT